MVLFASPLLAAAVVLVASADYDPHILSATFADGRVMQIPATNRDVCDMAIRAIERGWFLGYQPQVVAVTCARGNLFSERSKCIVGFNCPDGIR